MACESEAAAWCEFPEPLGAVNARTAAEKIANGRPGSALSEDIRVFWTGALEHAEQAKRKWKNPQSGPRDN